MAIHVLCDCGGCDKCLPQYYDAQEELMPTNGSSHEADTWIAEQWMSKTVREVSGICNLDRTGKVVETLFDEKGKLHCRCETSEDYYFWCPAACLCIAE